MSKEELEYRLRELVNQIQIVTGEKNVVVTAISGNHVVSVGSNEGQQDLVERMEEAAGDWLFMDPAEEDQQRGYTRQEEYDHENPPLRDDPMEWER